jgi:pyruvate dehydrogenase E1 component
MYRALTDSDPAETSEWIASLDALVEVCGTERAKVVLQALDRHASEAGLKDDAPPFQPYRNSISIERQPVYTGDIDIENRLTSIIRWNALAMVVRANSAYGELGGHISSYASAAEIFEVGFNHFFKGGQFGDLVFYQPHSAPGIYARAYLEGRLTEEQLSNYRQEVGGKGLCSYPHPWLMPDFWQVPTGSMGIGPISAVYQARFMRYLQNRGLAETSERHVWGIFGDGEMDEPESIAGLSIAAREQLDNLTFIINCNLQRLDGPVRGNGQIIQELESLFKGAGWNVIKVLWGSEWDPLFARDKSNILLKTFSETVDGKYQTLGAKDGAYNLANFFESDEKLRTLVAHMSPSEIDALRRGGHDFRKLFAAFQVAKQTKGRPTVILAKTKKGYGMGGAGESKMTAHQAKKLDVEALIAFRDKFSIPLTNEQVARLEFYRPDEQSSEMKYLRDRRAALGGYTPQRLPASKSLRVPALESYSKFALETGGKEMSTTVAAVRLFSNLLKDKELGPRIVPIVADEARTFGMANLFRQVGIYSPVGQLYEPEDAGSMLYYREATDGQLLEEGITEAGAISSWTAAATAYSIHGEPLLPFYIYYSMFGFQRVGDLIWAAADQRARGFLIGATAGKTTLAGEGLQHQDGSSHLVAYTVPNCRAYDPGYAYELAVIIDHGARAMLENGKDEFYYITAMNDIYSQPDMPPGAEEGILRGMYRLSGPKGRKKASVRLLGSGAILPEVVKAANRLQEEFGVICEVFSVTSYPELARNAFEVERQQLFCGSGSEHKAYVTSLLDGEQPVIAATDYVRGLPLLIAPYVRGRFIALGTDGFGRSDTRSKLRQFFEVDSSHIVLAALSALVERGEYSKEKLADAVLALGQTGMKPAAPWTV